MISALLLIDAKGKNIVSRYYRADVTRESADAFRTNVIAKKDTGSNPPITYIDGTTFIYVRNSDHYIVAVTKKNASPGLIFHFLFHLVKMFKSYFGTEYKADDLRDKFSVVYEIFDEVLDYGYPQNCAIDLMKQLIRLGKASNEVEEDASTITSQVTGAIDWRREGITYRKNEIFIDTLESVNLLISQTGAVLRSEVVGKIVMKAYLTGMPECRFGLNDKLLISNEKKTKGARRGKGSGVEIDDCSFHRCVRLGQFDQDRTITFIPPDGEFELMKYRVTENINLPFRILPVYEEISETTLKINIKVIANFSKQVSAQNVELKIPVPPNTANVIPKVGFGSAEYNSADQTIDWTLRKLTGGQETTFSAEVKMLKMTNDKVWSKPPINVIFAVPSFTASGLHVRFLKVYEKSSYQTVKWVRYMTRSGDYQIRL
ncbi:adaptor protein complex 2, subunit mu 1 [Blastocystis sp. ATCC 50177/Nand II]|uniref:Adaptor protein complex 2, subunit mu 1 n=1 Tax=Blastocystis sp. subtype 1 (strain ATCC 50177 / NandII) TaxID=478820 RepID=A0A196SE40_BLAHN|nr:adaptor protein complex 2, subunit mu 1 [Blastocystis sp. ATCC 50177/Nand II]